MKELDLSHLLNIWGKTDPFHPLLFHMVDVGNVGRELFTSAIFQPVKIRLLEAAGCSETQLNSWLGYFLSMHDIGKCHPEFQIKDSKSVKKLENNGLIFLQSSYHKFFHSLYSAQWIKNFFKKQGWNLMTTRTVSEVILGHHGKFSQSEIRDHPKIHENWEPFRRGLHKLILDYFNPDDWIPKKFFNHSLVGLLLLGLLVLSDWIASNNYLFKFSSIKYSTIEEYYNQSKLLAKNAVNILGFNHILDWSRFKKISDIYPGFPSLTPIQHMTEDFFQNLSEHKLIIIEAPMGEGKTEAALYIASQLLERQRGIYFALPTSATSNQMYGRLKEFLLVNDPMVEENVQLVHGMAWMIDHLSYKNPSLTNRAYDWFKPKKRALLAPFGVGTIDQSLMSVLWVRFGFLRLLGLTGKVLIIDEVHAYDAYMSTILTRLLKWAFILKIPVILLSATLPLSKKKILIDAYSGDSEVIPMDGILNSQTYYPLITVKNETKLEIILPKQISQKKTITVVLEDGLLERYYSIADLAIMSALKDKCVCVICNTVKNSQKIYQILKEKISKEMEIHTCLFHARFPVERRMEIENNVLELFDKRSSNFKISNPNNKRPRRAILIATQVVEQSLDLDFDEIISEIAPIDLLIQRMGRLHRHNRPYRPSGIKAVFRILLPNLQFQKFKFGLSEYVYHRYILLMTFNELILKSKRNKKFYLIFPDDIRQLIESVYENFSQKKFDKNQPISPEILEEALQIMTTKLEKEENQAKLYLIPPPNNKRFDFSNLTKPFEEDDSGAQSFLYAKTRIGNTTHKTILLNNHNFDDLLDKKKPPSAEIQRSLMKRSVSLPINWFKNKISNFKTVEWLSNSFIIHLEDNNFTYVVNKNNKIVHRVVIDHLEYGVYMEER